MARKPYTGFSDKTLDILIGGPSHRWVVCKGCNKEWLDYRQGSHDWQPRDCHKCEAKKLVNSIPSEKLKEFAKSFSPEDLKNIEKKLKLEQDVCDVCDCCGKPHNICKEKK